MIDTSLQVFVVPTALVLSNILRDDPTLAVIPNDEGSPSVVLSGGTVIGKKGVQMQLTVMFRGDCAYLSIDSYCEQICEKTYPMNDPNYPQTLYNGISMAKKTLRDALAVNNGLKGRILIARMKERNPDF